MDDSDTRVITNARKGCASLSTCSSICATLRTHSLFDPASRNMRKLAVKDSLFGNVLLPSLAESRCVCAHTCGAFRWARPTWRTGDQRIKVEQSRFRYFIFFSLLEIMNSRRWRTFWLFISLFIWLMEQECLNVQQLLNQYACQSLLLLSPIPH